MKVTESLKARLGIGAALLGGVTLILAALLYLGMTRVADRLDAALTSEARMTRYAILSREVSTFLVIATETVQTGQPADARAERLTPVSGALSRTFTALRADLEGAVDEARGLGLDMQSRHATQSLGLARMEALLDNTLSALRAPGTDRARLRAHIDSFANAFDPLLNAAVNTERIFRNDILSGIEDLRQRLSLAAIVLALLAVGLAAAFHFGLIRPQFRRLDRLRDAAQEIGQENFVVSLPAGGNDEIGRLYAETGRMAAALAARRDAVRADRARLNETIAQRTEALRVANVRLEEIDAARRRFFADISHELRTPLTVILMEAQIGRQGGEGASAAFATIEARADRLNRRIDDLLRVARSDTGQLMLDPVATPLDRIAAQVVEEVRAEIDTEGLTLEVAEMPALQVTCDPNWLRQVVVGLLRNALRHARDGGRLRLAPVTDEARGGFSITDNGPGIARADQAWVFERFAQAGRAQGAGFGIGLALAKWVIEAQGGAIDLQSPVRRADALGPAPGTKISVRLPRATG
ncbi:sensor histidine kinase [Roseovarius sp. D22-M7]|uniref:sensor histidine kinase n=1 Tax=Roseovarius sp. D22-M7 TaxID=3127116 RepID=UPI00300FD6C3